MSKTSRALGDLRPNRGNPRTVSGDKLAMLQKTLARFGDLGGVVFNRRTGQLVGGHQRVEAFKAAGADAADAVVVEASSAEPNRCGTVLNGHVMLDGERFSYREVDWDEPTEKAANIAANKGAGEWDMTALTGWLNDLESSGFDMDLTMFDSAELAGYLPDGNDLLSPSPAGADPEAGEAADRGNGETVGSNSAQPAAAHIKLVQLFFTDAHHAQFIELADGLRDAYGRDNLSDTVLEALRRAAVTAAVK